MLTTFILLAAMTASPAVTVTIDENAPIPTCDQVQLTSEVDTLLRPVLLARADEQQAGRSWDEKYEAAFYQLINSKDSHALEAQVALMAYYVGEHYGEELLCSLHKHASDALLLIEQYRTCRPRTSFEDQLSDIVVLHTLYDQAKVFLLKDSEPCEE